MGLQLLQPHHADGRAALQRVFLRQWVVLPGLFHGCGAHGGFGG